MTSLLKIDALQATVTGNPISVERGFTLQNGYYPIVSDTKAQAIILATRLKNGLRVLVRSDESLGGHEVLYTVNNALLTSPIETDLNRFKGASVSTAADLRTYGGAVHGDTVDLVSYYEGWATLALGPTGGGRFVWDSLCELDDDGGFVFQVTGVVTGRWRRINTGTISPLHFGARGDGVADDTVPVNASIGFVPVGGTLTLTPAYVFRVTGEVIFNKRMSATGNGEILWDGAANQGGILKVTAAEVKLLGMRVRHVGTAYTVRGILVYADDVVIDNCDVLNCHSGIQVRFDGGEYFRATITNNRVLDVTGQGLGPNSSSSTGESDGDGIVTWGAMATISNNTVSCKVGSDARIGIHCEGLSPNSPSQPLHSESLCTVTGNVVYGQFRRGIAFEDIDASVMSGNTVADSTWWPLSLNQTRGCTMSGNTVVYTRQAGQNQGSHYTPVRAAIMAYGRVEDCVFSNNTVVIQNNAECPMVIAVQGAQAGRVPERCSFTGNKVRLESGTLARGLQIIFGAEDIEIKDNYFQGFSVTGILCAPGPAYKIMGNKVIGLAGAATIGISTSASDNVMIKDNHIENINTGPAGGRAIECYFRKGHMITGNLVKNCGTGVDTFSATDSFVNDNVFINVTTPTTNIGSGSTSTPNISITV